MMRKFSYLAFLPPWIVNIFADFAKYKAIISQIMNYCNSFLAKFQIIPAIIDRTASRGHIIAEAHLPIMYLSGEISPPATESV